MAHYTVLDTIDGGGSGGGTPGGAAQIAFGDATGTAFTSSADLTYTDSTNELLLSVAESGGQVGATVTNSSNTASSDARITASVGGTSANDPFYQSAITGGATWSWGADNSVTSPYADPFKVVRDTTLGGTQVFQLSEEFAYFGGSGTAIHQAGANRIQTAPRDGTPNLLYTTISAGTEKTALVLGARGSSVGSDIGLEFAPASGTGSDIAQGAGGSKIFAGYVVDKYRFEFHTKAGGGYVNRLTIDNVGIKATTRIQGAKGADVASAGTLTLGSDGNYFVITGNTACDFITTTDWQAGSVIYLEFTGAPTFNHATGSPPANTAALALAGAANFGATAGDTLTLAYNGTVWRELARTVI